MITLNTSVFTCEQSQHCIETIKCWHLGAVSIKRCCLTGIGISMLKIRRSHDSLIFNLGIPISGKDGLYIETGPSSSRAMRSLHISSAIFNHVWWAKMDPKAVKPDIFVFSTMSSNGLMIIGGTSWVCIQVNYSQDGDKYSLAKFRTRIQHLPINKIRFKDYKQLSHVHFAHLEIQGMSVICFVVISFKNKERSSFQRNWSRSNLMPYVRAFYSKVITW